MNRAEAATSPRPTIFFFDRTVPAEALDKAAEEAALALSKLNLAAHAATKLRARGEVIKLIRKVIDEDITPQYGEDRVTRRASA